MLSRIVKTDAEKRRQQITTLKVFNDNVREVSAGQEYQLAFNSGGNDLVIKVTLGNEFPNEKPILRIIPPVIHNWVNSEGEIISAPGLLNFSIHSDLGRVVQAIIREFERNPPPLASGCIVSPTIPIRDGDRQSPSFPTLPVIKSFSPPAYLPKPNYSQSVAFPQLNSLTIEELQFINDNLDRQQEFLDDIPPIKEQYKYLDDTITEIENLTEENLSKQEQLKELKKGIDLRIEEATKLAFENERLHTIYQNLSEKYSPRNIKELLRLAAESADREGESIAEKFLQGEMDVEDFVTQYTKIRKLCQTRKTKEEKLSQQLDSLEKAGF